MVLIGPDRHGIAAATRGTLPCFTATLREDTDNVPAGRPVIAFAGIGRPAKFFDGLARCGIQPRRCLAFADHHAYTPSECGRLLALAQQWDASLVTTEKDAVRLPPAVRARVHTVGLQLDWSLPAMPDHILDLWLGRMKDG